MTAAFSGTTSERKARVSRTNDSATTIAVAEVDEAGRRAADVGVEVRALERLRDDLVAQLLDEVLGRLRRRRVLGRHREHGGLARGVDLRLRDRLHPGRLGDLVLALSASGIARRRAQELLLLGLLLLLGCAGLLGFGLLLGLLRGEARLLSLFDGLLFCGLLLLLLPLELVELGLVVVGGLGEADG